MCIKYLAIKCLTNSIHLLLSDNYFPAHILCGLWSLEFIIFLPTIVILSVEPMNHPDVSGQRKGLPFRNVGTVGGFVYASCCNRTLLTTDVYFP